jgi:hypothetical protein
LQTSLFLHFDLQIQTPICMMLIQFPTDSATGFSSLFRDWADATLID